MLRRGGADPNQTEGPPEVDRVAAAVVVLAIVLPIGWWSLTETRTSSRLPFDGKLNPSARPPRSRPKATTTSTRPRLGRRGGLRLRRRLPTTPPVEELPRARHRRGTERTLWTRTRSSRAISAGSRTLPSPFRLRRPHRVARVGPRTAGFRYYFLDWKNGKVRDTVTSTGSKAAAPASASSSPPGRTTRSTSTTATAESVTSWASGNIDAGVTVSSSDPASAPSDDLKEAFPARPTATAGSGRSHSDDVLHVYDIESGEPDRREGGRSPYDQVLRLGRPDVRGRRQGDRATS